MRKVYVAMSGGVDSAATALLLKELGYEVIGVTMMNIGGSSVEEPAYIADAKKVCEVIGIEHETVDLRQEFDEQVIGEFISEYEAGRTPNPCVTCNKCLKFGLMFPKDGDSLYATGHYANIEYDKDKDRYILKKAKDLKKDQSYMLYNLTQEQMRRTIFPLGEYTKDEIREYSAQHGIPVSAKHDSQDICFIPDKDYAGFIEKRTGAVYEPGNFVEKSTGKILGQHKGQIHYTTGQRRGLGLSLPASLYVCEKNIETNTVYLCTDEELYTDTVIAENVNFCSIERPKDGEKIGCEAKIRYAHKPAPAVFYMDGEQLIVRFDEPVRAVTAGQSVVLYDKDTVLGGGRITDRQTLAKFFFSDYN